MNLDEIYTELIREHSRNPANKRALSGDGVRSERGFNPSCGDEITLQLKVEDGVISDMAFEGDGCAISQASTSLMIDLLKGKTAEEAKEIAQVFIAMIKREITDEDVLIDTLEDAYAFQNISNMPSRVKCAVLAWHTLLEMLKDTE